MVDLRVVREGAIASEIAIALAAQKGAANGVAPLDAASKVPAANSRVVSVAARQGAVTLGVADVSGAVSDTDTRLSNTRTPTDGSVTNASVAANAAIAKTKLAALSIANADVASSAAIAESKLVLASDGPVGTATRRTLGTGALQAAPGNDARLRTIRDEGVSLADRAILDFLGSGVIVEDDSTTGRTKVTISGAAAGAASETAAGITEQATQTEVETGTAGNLFATVARLKAELDRRGPMDAFVELLRNNTVGGQVIPTGSFTPVGWGFEVVDGRNWLTGTNPDRITPDAPGYYAGMVYTIWDANTIVGRREVLVRKWSGGASTTIAREVMSSGSGAQFNSASPMSVPFASYIAQGEYFTVEVFQNSGAGLNLDNTSRFNLARVR